jgi:hypothetical protein
MYGVRTAHLVAILLLTRLGLLQRASCTGHGELLRIPFCPQALGSEAPSTDPYTST